MRRNALDIYRATVYPFEFYEDELYKKLKLNFIKNIESTKLY